MGIAPRQIGWSNESNLLWNISKQLDRLTAVMANISPGGGGTNPTSTFVPFNNAGTFADSFLVNDTTASVLKTVYSASDIGLKLDLAGNAYLLGNADQGLHIYLNTNRYYFGDVGSLNNNTLFVIDDGINLIKTTNQGNEIGLKLDFANGTYNLGDFGAAVNGSFLGIDDSNECWVTSNNVTETTAGASANKYILVKIGSTVYKLQLFNYA